MRTSTIMYVTSDIRRLTQAKFLQAFTKPSIRTWSCGNILNNFATRINRNIRRTLRSLSAEEFDVTLRKYVSKKPKNTKKKSKMFHVSLK